MVWIFPSIHIEDISTEQQQASFEITFILFYRIFSKSSTVLNSTTCHFPFKTSVKVARYKLCYQSVA